MEKKWTIRETRKSDAQAIFSIIVVGWLDTYVNDELGVTRDFVLKREIPKLEYSFFRDEFRYDLLENSVNNVHFVAEDANGVILGFIHGHRDEETQELTGLYICKEMYWTGLAQELARKFEEWEDKDRDSLVHVVSYNQRAINFYQKLGFIKNGKNDMFADIIPCVYMTKKNVVEEEK
jgi:GNAT superfamily N-acetyltransferase